MYSTQDVLLTIISVLLIFFSCKNNLKVDNINRLETSLIFTNAMKF
jgi:hypothetical protein